MTLITLHGEISKFVGKKSYRLKVSSVGESIRAIESISKRKLYKYLTESEKRGIKYRVIINGRDFTCEEIPTVENPDSIVNSELMMNLSNLSTIDIVPVIEGAGGNGGSIGAIIAGVVLIIVGIVFSFTGVGAAIGVPLIIAGLGLVAAGVINLLSSPPSFEPFNAIQGDNGNISYLFNGPQNTTREGGPVFVGYGRLIVGSHVIASSYEPTDRKVSEVGLTI